VDAAPTDPLLADAPSEGAAAAGVGIDVHGGGQQQTAEGDANEGDTKVMAGNTASQDDGATGMAAATAANANPLPGLAGGTAVHHPATTSEQEVFTPRRWTAAELQLDDPLI
jgi:hypothetical protein